MTFRELSQKVIIRFGELSIIYGLKFLSKELKESKEVNGVSIVTVISWIMCTLARDTSIKELSIFILVIRTFREK